MNVIVSFCTSILLLWGTYLESNAKEDVVQEEKCNTSFRNFGLMSVARQLIVSDHHRDDQVTEALTSRSVHEHLSSTPALNIGNTDGREEQIAHTVDGSKQASHGVAESDRFDQYRRQIV